MTKNVDAWKSLNAFLGVYGVKTSLLTYDADYWHCAQALWPHIKRHDGDRLHDLQKRIKDMHTRYRRETAKKNVHRLPAQFLSSVEKHQTALASSLMRAEREWDMAQEAAQ